MDWKRDKTVRQIRAESKASHDAAAYLRDLEDAARARNRAQHDSERPKAPQPSKAQLRAEATEAIAAWEVEHPRPAPWGPWTPWRTVTRADGTTYQERERQRQPRE